MKPDWKPVKDFEPFCPKCKERLAGDNSIMTPYSCLCGIWESTWQEPLEFTIKPKIDEKM